MKIAQKTSAIAGLSALLLSLTACEPEPGPQATTEPAPSNIETVSSQAAVKTPPVFAIATDESAAIDLLLKPVSAPADLSFKNSCRAGTQAFGLSDVNFGGKLYCSDAISRSIHVMDLSSGNELFVWAWPAEIVGNPQWLIGRWEKDAPVGLAAYDATKGIFHVFNAVEKGFAFSQSFEYGGTGKLAPLIGDWNGDGKDSVGVYKQDSLQMDLRNSLDAGIADVSFRFVEDGIDKNALPVSFNHDGRSDAALYSVAEATITIGSADAAKQPQSVFQFGAPGKVKTPLIVR